MKDGRHRLMNPVRYGGVEQIRSRSSSEIGDHSRRVKSRDFSAISEQRDFANRENKSCVHCSKCHNRYCAKMRFVKPNFSCKLQICEL